MAFNKAIQKRIMAPLVLAALGLALYAGWIRNNTTDSQRARGHGQLIVQTREWDFGVVSENVATLRHAFEVYNAGVVPVILKAHHVGCNCTSVEVPETVQPGKTGLIRIEIEIRAREGPFGTRVKLVTSDPALSVLEFTLRYNAPPGIDLDPPVIRLFAESGGASLETMLDLTIAQEEGETTVKVPEVVTYHSAIACTYLGSRMREALPGALPRRTYRFQVKVDTGMLAKSAPVHVADGLRIKVVRRGDILEKSVPLELMFEHHRFLKGQTVVYLRGAAGGEEPRVRFWSREKRAFTVTKTHCSMEFVKVKVAKEEALTMHELVVSVDDRALSEKMGVLEGVIDVYTSLSENLPYRISVMVTP